EGMPGGGIADPGLEEGPHHGEHAGIHRREAGVVEVDAAGGFSAGLHRYPVFLTRKRYTAPSRETPISSFRECWAQTFMSASEAGSSESISRICPSAISRSASRVFTIGMGQKSPVQSICLSTLTTLETDVMSPYPTPRRARASSKRAPLLDSP